MGKTFTAKLADGKEYEFKTLNLNELFLVERRFKMNWGKILLRGVNADVIRFMVYLSLKGRYHHLNEKKVGELVTVDLMIINGGDLLETVCGKPSDKIKGAKNG